MSETGFYRVFKTKRKDIEYYRYQVRNKLLQKEITRKDIYELKQAVEEAGLLWGIIDLEKAKSNSQKYKIKSLEGAYGIKIDGD